MQVQKAHPEDLSQRNMRRRDHDCTVHNAVPVSSTIPDIGHGQTQLLNRTPSSLQAQLIQSCARSKVPMGSYHYTSQFVFAAADSNPNPSHKPRTTVQIPITSPSPPEGTREEAREGSPDRDAVAAAAKIQADLRGHLVRRHATAVRAADAEATRLERLLRRQETVDAVRGEERERARFSEALMAVLLRLDAVLGHYPAVRDARRAVSRRVVGLQEVFDAVVAAPEAHAQTCGVPASLEQVLEGIWGVGDAPVPVPQPAAAVEEEVRKAGSCWGWVFGGV